MQYFVEIIANTPFWVWVILVALVALGLGQTRTERRSFSGLVIPAVVFAVIALAKLGYARFAADALFGTLGGGVLGIALILLTRPGRRTEKLADGSYLIRGEWMPLVVILVVFVGNYFVAVISAIAPELAQSTAAGLAVGAINGFSALYMAGRTIAHLRAGQNRSDTASRSPLEV